MEKSIKRYWLLFLFPALAVLCTGFLYPVLRGVCLSFCNPASGSVFCGFSNYARLLTDPAYSSDFLRAFLFTLSVSAASALLVNACAFLLSLLLTGVRSGSAFFYAVLFLPCLIGGTAAGGIWKSVFSGFSRIPGLSFAAENGLGTFLPLLTACCWQQTGYAVLLYSAALQSIPSELTDAAFLDGAGRLQRFFRITLPAVLPCAAVCFFLSLTLSFRIFDLDLVLSQNASAGRTLALYVCDLCTASAPAAKGAGQSAAVLFSLSAALPALLFLRLFRRREVHL